MLTLHIEFNQLEKLEAAKAAGLVCLSILSLTGPFLALLGPSEDIGSFRGELLERLQEKREGLWKKWETEVSKLEGGWRPWRWWPGRPYARSVGLGAHCPAHRRPGLSKAVRSQWAGYLNTTDSQHWQHCSGVSHNWIFLDPIGSLASSVYIISNVQCVMCNM